MLYRSQYTDLIEKLQTEDFNISTVKQSDSEDWFHSSNEPTTQSGNLYFFISGKKVSFLLAQTIFNSIKGCCIIAAPELGSNYGLKIISNFLNIKIVNF